MSDISERYARITGQFTDRVLGVPADGWNSPAPCEGWTARDVVGHLTQWIPGFFGGVGVTFPEVPSVQDDPVGAWTTVQAVISDAIADSERAASEIETPFGRRTFADTVDMIVIGDVFTHTWDLSRATGQSDTLDPGQLQIMVAGMGTIPEEAMRGDGMFGPWLEVPDNADDQTKFLAYVGRRQ